MRIGDLIDRLEIPDDSGFQPDLLEFHTRIGDILKDEFTRVLDVHADRNFQEPDSDTVEFMP
jgi:hypothetical protein